MSKAKKASKKLKGLFFKGAVLLGGLGALTAAPIVPGIIGYKRKREAEEPNNKLVPSPEFMLDSYRRIDTGNSSNNDSSSLFDSLPFQGAPIPKPLRKELARYMPSADTFSEAECLQKSFCENLVELDDTPFQESILFFYSA